MSQNYDCSIAGDLGPVDPDGPAVGCSLVAQAQDRRGLAVAGQEGGDVAVPSAVAHDGLAEAGQPRLTWAMIRRVTAVRVCWPGVSGTLSMMAVAGRAAAGRGDADAVCLAPAVTAGYEC